MSNSKNTMLAVFFLAILLLVFFGLVLAAPPSPDSIPTPDPPSSCTETNGGIEQCDNVDNDCNNQTDEGCDDDNDDYCDSSMTFVVSDTCSLGGGDCVDTSSSVNPGVVEDGDVLLCDAVDNDCDGSYNEGITRFSDEQDGLCGGNTDWCNDEGTWVASLANYVPDVEDCDGLDNDCNNQTDESLSAPFASNQEGVCVFSRQLCNGTQGWVDPDYADWSPSYADSEDGVESLCDGLDNDCDDNTDENIFKATTCGTGECAGNTGQISCVAGNWSNATDTCNPLFGAGVELCTAASDDEDCDGSVNEDCNCTTGAVQPCGPDTDEGKCVRGNQTCVAGTWGACVGAVFADALDDTCDGVDNDCDGSVDEDAVGGGLADMQFGVCAGAMKTCINGNWTEPNYSSYHLNYTANESNVAGLWCDSLDNDCDNETDEFISQITSCGYHGICADNIGLATCLLGGFINDTCDPYYGSTSESCDGVDNDCDGSVDEISDCFEDDTPKKSGGGGGGGGGGFYPPASSTVDEDSHLPDGSIKLSWTYKNEVASTSVSELPFSVRRVYGLVSEDDFNNFEDNSGLRIIDDRRDIFAEKGYAFFKSLTFTDDAIGVSFDELKVSFIVDDSWLESKNITQDKVKILYFQNGVWTEAETYYSDDSKLYTSLLKDVVLGEFVIAANDDSLKELAVIETPIINESVNESVVYEAPVLSKKQVISANIIILFCVILSVGLFFISKYYHVHHSWRNLSKQKKELLSATNRQSFLDTKHPVHLSQLDQYILSMHSKGYSDDYIYKKLTSAGWNSDYVKNHIIMSRME